MVTHPLHSHAAVIHLIKASHCLRNDLDASQSYLLLTLFELIELLPFLGLTSKYTWLSEKLNKAFVSFYLIYVAKKYLLLCVFCQTNIRNVLRIFNSSFTRCAHKTMYVLVKVDILFLTLAVMQKRLLSTISVASAEPRPSLRPLLPASEAQYYKYKHT